jgi:hypothetical protein
MPDNLPASKHFTLQPLTQGVYACIHKPGGGAFSNAGIIDLGGAGHTGRTLQEALQISLPEPFDQWLMGGKGLFEGNVLTLFKRLGGEVPEEK